MKPHGACALGSEKKPVTGSPQTRDVLVRSALLRGFFFQVSSSVIPRPRPGFPPA